MLKQQVIRFYDCMQTGQISTASETKAQIMFIIRRAEDFDFKPKFIRKWRDHLKLVDHVLERYGDGNPAAFKTIVDRFGRRSGVSDEEARALEREVRRNERLYGVASLPGHDVCQICGNFGHSTLDCFHGPGHAQRRMSWRGRSFRARGGRFARGGRRGGRF
mmetsp:Transcript_32273/g.41384  ORF Transcript_32273/g.41384 Transcript_32273/m.41384 type:complete len:162 (+) Transcript_32273:37-522(+)